MAGKGSKGRKGKRNKGRKRPQSSGNKRGPQIVRPRSPEAKPAGPYTELRSQAAVERLMSPGGGTGVIDFWAPWCAPCRAFAPLFEAVAQEHADDPITFFKLNTQDQPDEARAFNIRSIPTLVFVHDGEIMDTNVGMMDAGRFRKRVKWLLARARGEKSGLLSRLFGG